MKKYLVYFSILYFIKEVLVVVVSFLFSESVNTLIENEIIKSLLILSSIALAFYVANILGYLFSIAQEKHLAENVTILRNKLLASKKDYELAQLLSNIDVLENNYFSSQLEFVANLCSTFISLIGVFILSYWMGIVVILICIFNYFITGFFEKHQQKAIENFNQESEFFTNKVNDLYLGRNDFKTNNLLSRFSAINQKIFNNFKNHRIKFKKKMSLIVCGFAFVGETSQLIAFLTCFVLVGLGYVKVGTLLALMMLLSPIFNSYSQISIYYNKIKASRDLLKPYDFKKDDKNILPICHKQIELKNINFKYDDKLILENANFLFERNKKYAIIAESGKGKTTLLKLLSGQLPINDGQILIDNQIVSNYQGLANLSYLAQSNHIFNDSLEFNLSLGAKISEDKLKEMMKQLDINKFLANLNDRLEINGSNISGGQKQRIILARNLLLEKDIVLLDESLSHLDMIASKEIEDLLLKDKNITLIMVSHQFDKQQLSKYDCIYQIN